MTEVKETVYYQSTTGVPLCHDCIFNRSSYIPCVYKRSGVVSGGSSCYPNSCQYYIFDELKKGERSIYR